MSFAKKLQKVKKFWKGFNPIKIFMGYKRIELTRQEAEDIFLKTRCLETDKMARVIADRTGIPLGIVLRIVGDSEYDVFGQIGLMSNYEHNVFTKGEN